MLNSAVDFVSDVSNLLFSIKVSPDDVVGLHERVELPLQVLVLLSEKQGVLLQRLVLGLEVKVSIHKCLVGVVDSFQVSVLAPLVDFQAIEFGLEPLQRRRELMRQVVLLAVLGQLLLLIINQNAIILLSVVYFNVESVDCALQSRDVSLGRVDAHLALVTLLGSSVELLVERDAAVDQGCSLLFEY